MIPSEVLDAMGESAVVRAILLHFEFLTDPKRIHLGYGPVKAGGHVWQGIGEAGGMQGLERASRGSAPQATFSLSGVDNDHLSAFLSQRTEVKGRKVNVYAQFYTQDLQPIDYLLLVYSGRMDRMSLRRSVSTSTVYVTAEQPFARRARVPNGTLSDRDQKRLFPGDRGLELIAQIENHKAYWPIIVA